MWKLVNAVQPNSTSEIFQLTYSEAINNGQNKVVISYCHRTIGERSLPYTGYKLWNQEVPVDIKSEKTFEAFNKVCRKYPLSNINT